MRVQVNQDGLKLNGTHQFRVYADSNTLGGSVHIIRKTAEALVVASKENGLEVSVDKNKYMVMSCLEIIMQEEVTIKTFITHVVPLEGRNKSNT